MGTDMKHSIYWIERVFPGRLGIAARPRGGDWLEDEIKAWRANEVDIAISLLTPDEEEELGLKLENKISESNGLEFHSLPIADRGVPESNEPIILLADKILQRLLAGKNAILHCRQSVGRSGMMAATVLIESGMVPHDAIRLIRNARNVEIPETKQQMEWIESLAKIHTGNH